MRRIVGRRCLFAFAILCTTLMSGLVYGWPALRRHLLTVESSALNEKQLGAIFTIGAWSSQGGRFFAGLARDRYGTRMTAFCFGISAALGVLGLAFAKDVTMLAVSLFLVGLGSGVQLCLQPVARLFPQNSANVLFILTGAFLTSGLMFLVLTSASNSRKASFLGYATVLFGLGIVILVVLPKEFIVKQCDELEETGFSTVSLHYDETEETTDHTMTQEACLEPIELV